MGCQWSKILIDQTGLARHFKLSVFNTIQSLNVIGILCSCVAPMYRNMVSAPTIIMNKEIQHLWCDSWKFCLWCSKSQTEWPTHHLMHQYQSQIAGWKTTSLVMTTIKGVIKNSQSIPNLSMTVVYNKHSNITDRFWTSAICVLKRESPWIFTLKLIRNNLIDFCLFLIFVLCFRYLIW